MKTYLFEATNGFNWGKFCIGVMDVEWEWRSRVDTTSSRNLLAARGWSTRHVWVMDLQTGEGALFWPGGLARSDLNSHQIWVCPLFEPFLEWLYQQDLSNLAELSESVVNLPEAPAEMYGYRRSRQDGRGENDEATTAPMEETPTGDLEIVRAPFTDEQVAGLNAYQTESALHPFTCGNNSTHPVLVAAREGLHCTACTYTQQWAHAAMADGRWVEASRGVLEEVNARLGRDRG